MRSVATSVRVSGDAIAVLSGLSARLGQSKAQVIEIALREMADRVFWAEVRSAFARSGSDPDDAARQAAEVELWDSASAVDFADEKW